MPEAFPILIMIAPHGASPAEQWVSLGIRAAGLDLVHRLQALSFDLKIDVLAAELEDQLVLEQHGAIPVKSRSSSFQFGHALMEYIQNYDVEHMAYFGAGSAPLVTETILSDSIDQILRSNEPMAVVNNLHSTDWAIFNKATSLQGIAERLPSDNSLGWILQTEFGYQVQSLPISAATRADIDTPTDLLMIKDHPNLGASLHNYLSTANAEAQNPVDKVRAVMESPANHLTIIGRASSRVWQEVERRTQIWTRLFVEERGMVASGRMANGTVKSLVAELVECWGAEGFVDYLGSISDAVLWDTRVWMAHLGEWPSKSDRYAADLGNADEVKNEKLRELTIAVKKASIPILSGGHGVVAGGLFALLESLSTE